MSPPDTVIDPYKIDPPPEESRQVGIDLPRKLAFLLEGHRYKVAFGGRGSAKSWSFAKALLVLGSATRLRILCAREIQRSIEHSVYALLSDQIEALGLSGHYTVNDTDIVGGNGTRFIFTGLASHTVDSIKSFEAVDIVWVEEGQTVSKRSWDILVPTIRVPNSEIWVTFNPDMEDDETYQRFVINQRPDAVVVKMNFSDNPWFPDVLEGERAYMERTAPEDYDNIWMGNCRSIVAGAIFAKEIGEMIASERYRSVPYDPRLPVHTVWDLGWNDSMAIILLQLPAPGVFNIVNYFEDSYRSYAEFCAEFDKLQYRWGTDYLPHDGKNKNPITKTSAFDELKRLGRQKVKALDKAVPVEDTIRSCRMLFPRVYIDNSQRKAASGYIGGKRLYECLKHYARNVTQTTGEPGEPKHDQYSHGASAFRLLAVMAEQIRNDANRPFRAPLPIYQNSDPGMGPLGM